jgi:hypothetical protein
MAEFWARITAYDWSVIGTALTAAARGAKAEGDPRTMDQLRADALVAPFAQALRTGVLDGFPPMPLAALQRRPAQVQVMAPATVLLGEGGAAAELDGYGPIPGVLARAIATDAEWRRVLTDPMSGGVLDVARSTRRPPASLRRAVIARDRWCRFPGCGRPAEAGDLDHTVPFPAGPTSADNLGALCRRHHRLKHELPGTRLEQDDGSFTWTMPTGRRYRVDPPGRDANVRSDPDPPF